MHPLSHQLSTSPALLALVKVNGAALVELHSDITTAELGRYVDRYPYLVQANVLQLA